MRILVIDDEPMIADAVRRGLTAEGFVVDITGSGDEGLMHATVTNYDAIVLDIMLPGMNGFAVCKNLRERNIWTPILMLTAKDGDYDQAEALDTGADDYLTKPFSFVVLVARIRALLRRSTNRQPAMQLQVGNLTLDPTSHRCSRNGNEITLTSREFAVLEFLMRRAETVVTKAEILDNVWDFTFDGDVNIVEVYIRHLRTKIDEPFQQRSIETVRGVGYRLVAEGK